MKQQPIRLLGISSDVKGQVWEHEDLLRAGRLNSLEIVLDDNSVSRKHAEIRRGEQGWAVRDLESTNGTYVNGVRLGPDERLLKPRDIVQFGKVALIVELSDGTSTNGAVHGRTTRLPGSRHSDFRRTTGQDGQVTGPIAPLDTAAGDQQIVVEAATNSSWEDAVASVAYDRNRSPRPGEKLIALLRAGQHLAHIESEEELLHSILNDAVHVLDAQRGAIVLAEGPPGQEELKLRALATGRSEPPGRFNFSRKLARRCFDRDESLLCVNIDNNDELKVHESIQAGAMSSVLCVRLRTPRKRLGVLHLDRSYWKPDFSEDDLHMADALAAQVSAAIECAQLLRRQREMFVETITAMAQLVEAKDDYTGNHTKRVREYSLLLARELKRSPKELELIEMGAPLHDIGKIGVEDSILHKPGRLTPDEFEKMKKHTTKGDEILANIRELHPFRPIVRSHHERWDGKGYPDGLAGDAIPLVARIVAVADAFDAMTSARPYHPDQKGKPPEVAFTEIEQQAGKQFDPDCAAAFVTIRGRILAAMAGNGTISPSVAELMGIGEG